MSYTPRNARHATIKIGGVDYSEHLTFPFTIQDTGTEQLSTAMVMLVNLPTDAKFSPFTPVALAGDKYSYVIANDSVKEIFGRQRWNHELTLIDATKITERVLMEAKSFTQPLVTDYADGATNALYMFDGHQIIINKTLQGQMLNTYTSPQIYNGKIHIYSYASTIGKLNLELEDGHGDQTAHWKVNVYFSKSATISSPPDAHNVEQAMQNRGLEKIFSSGEITDPNYEFDIDVSEKGIYTIQYEIARKNYVSDGVLFRAYLYVPISLVDAPIEHPPLSLKELAEILLYTAEPLRQWLDNQKYRLVLTPEQEVSFAQRAPEMHFQNGRSLFENLEQIGSVVHAMPRARLSADGTVEIYFKDIGRTEYADLSKGCIFGSSNQFNAADYASTLESNFANLINTEDESEGSIVDPIANGFVTLRSNDARIKEGNSFIPTKFPIAKIKSVELFLHKEDGTKKQKDITKYIFEKSEYDALSSYSGIFPFSKTYALYYTMGSKNIDGLWYRVEDEAVSFLNSFKNYAIQNIVEEALGEKISKINEYFSLGFRVTYIPIINGRARQERTETTENGRFVMAYNQSANKMSAKAFGENLRGYVSMMANATESRLYLFKDLDDVPSAGALYDEKHYITTITTRVFPDFCAVQFDLSANYNAIGAYVELKNGIRQYEIPSGEPRFTLLEEFCVVGEYEHPSAWSHLLCGEKMGEKILKSFLQIEEYEDITAARIGTHDTWVKTDGGIVKTPIAEGIVLPVYSTSIGNSLYFGFNFEDNYSAGSRSFLVGDYETKEGNETFINKYRGTEYVAYGDPLYSQARYLSFDLFTEAKNFSIDDANELPASRDLTPKKVYISTGDYPLIWHKDSADAGNVAYQLHFVSNKGYVIGSELARMIPFIRSASGNATGETAKVFFYNKRINTITGEPESGATAVSDSALEVELYNQGEYGRFALNVKSIPDVPFKSWVIKRPNGKFILGNNSETIEKQIYFNFKRKR